MCRMWFLYSKPGSCLNLVKLLGKPFNMTICQITMNKSWMLGPILSHILSHSVRVKQNLRNIKQFENVDFIDNINISNREMSKNF